MESDTKLYTVKQVALISGVSVRTLHVYHNHGLLLPHTRTEKGYRLYGQQELLRLQQILFYRELDFPLAEIRTILHSPGWSVEQALQQHKQLLQQRSQRIERMITTINQTLQTIQQGLPMSHEDLYKGLPKEFANEYRTEAIQKWSKDTVEKSERALRKRSKPELQALFAEHNAIRATLLGMVHLAPHSATVQEHIAQHYRIIRKLWGTEHDVNHQREQYAGLGQLYVDDPRYTMFNDVPHPEFAAFMRDAMKHYADTVLTAG
ncbi:MAG: MerR family transcriptional regulator [Candidatus Kapabacteria bacterium]|nr:MerR family transcriptional regulator [Candidatus Kapabacteria bacterium]